VVLGASTTSPLSVSYNTQQVPNGAYSVIAKAYDAAGNIGTATRTINVSNTADTTPPVVSIATPPPGQIFATKHGSKNVTITVTATDNVALASISILIDNVLVKTCTTSPCSYTWNVNKVASGSSHTIRAVATDTSGNQASVTETVIK
jgi:Big-like domain-containing protein